VDILRHVKSPCPKAIPIAIQGFPDFQVDWQLRMLSPTKLLEPWTVDIHRDGGFGFWPTFHFGVFRILRQHGVVPRKNSRR